MTKPLHERLREYEKQCDNPFFEFGDGSKGFVTFSTYEASKLADEIERDYRLLPRFKDGPVKFGDEVDQGDYIFTARRINFYENGDVTVCDIGGQGRTYRPGELLERPTPKVCDADGAEIKVGEKLYNPQGHIFEVQSIEGDEDEWLLWCGETKCGIKVCYRADECTHERPVFDAEGERIGKGDTVWHKDTGEKHIVEELTGDGGVYIDRSSLTWGGEMLTHREPDSLEKLMYDISRFYSTDPEAMRVSSTWYQRIEALIERGA